MLEKKIDDIIIYINQLIRIYIIIKFDVQLFETQSYILNEVIIIAFKLMYFNESSHQTKLTLLSFYLIKLRINFFILVDTNTSNLMIITCSILKAHTQFILLNAICYIQLIRWLKKLQFA